MERRQGLHSTTPDSCLILSDGEAVQYRRAVYANFSSKLCETSRRLRSEQEQRDAKKTVATAGKKNKIASGGIADRPQNGIMRHRPTDVSGGGGGCC